MGRAARADRAGRKLAADAGRYSYEQLIDWSRRRGRMSALGQKQTSALQYAMSALPPKADISRVTRMSALSEPD